MPVDKEEKTVDIDTSGPGADVEIPEEKTIPVEQEETNAETDSKDDNQSDDTLEKSDKQPDVQDSEQKTEVQTEEKVDEKKEELEQYSEGVQKRISKLTKKWREAERQKEAALDYAKGGQVELSQLKTKMAKLEPSYVTAVENRVVSGLAAAKSKLMRAREAGDIDAEVDAQKEIGRLGMEEVRVHTLKNKLSETRETAVRTPSLDQALQAPPADPKAEEWAEKNEWFGKDNAMTYTAFDLHKKLVNEQGFDPKSDEYYTEIDKQIKLDFPHKFAKGGSVEPTKTTQLVASATRSVQPGRKTVRLTSSQVSIAKKLGVPLEDYAKQLKITEGV